MDTQKNNLQKKILLIDDDRDFLEALEEKFSLAGFEVLKAFDGSTGLVIAIEAKPDVIVLDILMPVMDGIAMLKQLRGNGWGINVPVIFLTNLNEKERLAEALGIGIDDYLIKTEVRLDDIVDKAKKLSSFTFRSTGM